MYNTKYPMGIPESVRRRKAILHPVKVFQDAIQTSEQLLTVNVLSDSILLSQRNTYLIRYLTGHCIQP